jgi:hypothetical protein
MEDAARSRGPISHEVEEDMKRLALCAGLVLFAFVLSSCAGDEKVTLKLVKYDELIKTIADQKGKVVVIDFWSDT